ncbi:cobaltochelatase, CobN subunit [Desulfofundulus kuznetsovii DSM 6115]|uniref:Cobaltochelatase, CobN subunit n=1 Tax=Desulfofundulus kuznetsovii (strain DSM 6115 / VKM B-1805 / 17) TaxID=760568 RepID=A0AAU8PX19_DESK7|nr:cobaltochelatase, CobN subunit [Desulfofundulus kuznetsovii DSM 6115]
MKLRILFYTAIEGELGSLSNAVRSVHREYGPLVEVLAYAKRDLTGPEKQAELLDTVPCCHLVILHLMGGPDSLPSFDRVTALAREQAIPLAVLPSAGDDTRALLGLSNLSEEDYRLVRLYVCYGGEENLKNLLIWSINRYLKKFYPVPEPKPLPWEGLYYPGCQSEAQAAALLEEKLKEGKPVVGILFYQSYRVTGNTGFVDELINQIENQGGVALPVFLYATRNDELGSRGIAWVVENYFSRQGRPLVDVVVNTLMFAQTMATPTFSRVEEKDLYLRLGVPLIKAIISVASRSEWENSQQGLGPLDVVMSVALPEFDGDLITVPVATREELERDPLTGAAPIKYVPVAERMQKVASLALRWARLRRKPNREKKVAIILHNYPPRNDRIGNAFGLDTPASVHRLLLAMREAGYQVEDLPPDGTALMEKILAGLTNERGWLEPRELERRAVARVEKGTYREWFSAFPENSQEHLERDWGPPPGEVFYYGDHLLVPGIFLGNVFLGVQPPRGFLEDPSKIYHSPDLSPPHHYLAYYRWLRDVFQADIVFHIGKHGSLEWLPGKGVGLSAACFPDLAINDLPHVYPYIVNNPGEGTQAKRRSHACIIDHLVPVMTRAGSYDELAEIEVILKEYNEAKMMDASRLPSLHNLIWEKVALTHLDRDLKITREAAEKDWEDFLEHLHSYLHEIKDTLIRDGLHILGQPPAGEALVEMLLALTRLPNGPVPSLREQVAGIKGFNYEALLSNPGYFDPDRGRTYGEMLDEIDNLARRLLEAFVNGGYTVDEAPFIVQKLLGKQNEEICRVLEYAVNTLVPALAATKQELDNCLNALAGGFVPPGPSGAPTRGMADILPTGRNFYSVDPQAVPSRAAWQVGCSLADALLERYRQEKGTYPGSVGIVVWATSNMRTGGDDIAQALYLMGVRPVWDEKSGRIKGLAVIPLEELGRPRIDVTIRASGMFRDAFLNVIHLIDQAVEMVANLDEPEDLNFVAAHVRQEVAEKVAQGINPEQAREEALWRIFSDPPGCYGAGVSNLITARNWRDEKDLGEVYVTWGGYAYSRRSFGKDARPAFRQRLALVEATVKNEDTREIDMYDSDDFYSYHGGMVAAVKAIKGEPPMSFSGDSSDPARVRVRTLDEETRHIFRARVLNPKWIESMKRHGYKGAGDLSHLVEVAFGWDATAGVLEDWLYEALAHKYALDPSMQDWFKEVNPWALQNIVEHLLEAIERGMWQAAPEMNEALRELYLEIEGELEARTE